MQILLKGLIDKGFTLIEGMLAHVQDHADSWRKKYEVFAEAFCRDLPFNPDGTQVSHTFNIFIVNICLQVSIFQYFNIFYL